MQHTVQCSAVQLHFIIVHFPDPDWSGSGWVQIQINLDLDGSRSSLIWIWMKCCTHCVTGARPTHRQNFTRFYTWYPSMSALHTGIWFQRISRVGFLVGSGSHLVVNYHPILFHRSCTSRKQVFWSIDLAMSALYNIKYLHWNTLTALCMGSGAQ